jgi:hypothetical protein
MGYEDVTGLNWHSVLCTGIFLWTLTVMEILCSLTAENIFSD